MSARKAAMEANPDLQAEYKAILKKMDAQQAKVDAAVVKADLNTLSQFISRYTSANAEGSLTLHFS